MILRYDQGMNTHHEPIASNHYRENVEDGWELLREDDPLNVGDEVRQELNGVTTIAVVGSVDGEGDPWTAEVGYIGPIRSGAWHVRRPIQELPTEGGAVIIPADGREYITATLGGETYIAREAMLSNDRWHGVWRTATGERVCYSVGSECITPDAWKVDEE